MKQSAFIRVALTVIGGIVCICLLCISGKGIMKEWRYDSQEAVLKYTEEMYMPGLAYLERGPGTHGRSVDQEKCDVMAPADTICGAEAAL